jgi:hypothetical protein
MEDNFRASTDLVAPRYGSTRRYVHATKSGALGKTEADGDDDENFGAPWERDRVAG